MVALQRLIEAYARRNTVRLRRLSPVEADTEGYPLYVLLHAALVASLAIFVPAATLPYWPLIGFFALLQLVWIWVIASLGRYWTMRIMTLPDAPLVRKGPFRHLRPPNYLPKVALLPLAFGAGAIGAIFSVLHVVLIARRMRIEHRVLAPRRGI